MDAKTLEGKHNSLKEKMINKDDFLIEDELEDDMEEDEGGGGVGFADDEKKKGAGVMYGKRGTGSGGASSPSCQVEKCGFNLADAKRYHRRHKVCEVHAKSPSVVVAGLRQRFCQQCSRYFSVHAIFFIYLSIRRTYFHANFLSNLCFPFPCKFPFDYTFDKRCFYQNLVESQFQRHVIIFQQ